MNKKVYSETQKRKILEEFKNSTESQRVFCQRIGVSRATLRKWMAKTNIRTNAKTNTKAKKEKETTDFGIIHLNTVREKEEAGIIHFKTDTIEIKLEKDYDKIMLQKIFEVFAYAK